VLNGSGSVEGHLGIGVWIDGLSSYWDRFVAKELSADSIAAGTGRTWDEWLVSFESVDAATLTHKEIVAAASKAGAPSWWRQMIAVKYEQHEGRRTPGQDSDGKFSVSASKTCTCSLDAALQRWKKVMASRPDPSGIAIERGPEVSSTEKWRHWRAGLADGTRAVVNISAKSPDNSVISVQHEKLLSQDAVEHWKQYWKSVLMNL